MLLVDLSNFSAASRAIAGFRCASALIVEEIGRIDDDLRLGLVCGSRRSDKRQRRAPISDERDAGGRDGDPEALRDPV